MERFDPFGKLADAQYRMAQMRMQQDQNALAMRMQEAQLAQAEEQRAMQGRTRNALASAIQPYGPFADDMYTPENPRPMGMEDIGRRVIQGGGDPFVGMGYIEKGMPQQGEGYNLSEGQTRFDSQNRPIASVPRPEKPAGSHGGSNPYSIPVQTADGVYSFDTRTGRMSPVDVGGKPVVGSSSDPNLQRSLSEAKSGGKVSGETTEKARIDLPMIEDNGNYTIQLVEDLMKHPGFKSYIGFTLRPGASLVDGTPEASFKAALDQIQGRQFLEAFQSLKGGGQITEIEGQKATAALSRMVKSNSEAQFGSAAREFQSIIRRSIQRAKAKSRGASGGWNDGPKPGAVEDGYRFMGGDPANPENWKKVN